MIKSFSCTNIHSQNSNETIKFYNEKLGIPILSTLVNESDGVNLGFIKNAPTICIWDANKWNLPSHGTVSLVFECDNLDETCKQLKEKGLSFDPPITYDWGTKELQIKDPDGNEVVVVEFLEKN